MFSLISAPRSLRIALGAAILATAVTPLVAAPVEARPANFARSFNQVPSGDEQARRQAMPLLFVGDNANNQISVFAANSKTQSPKPLRVISTGLEGPQGMTTDLAGNLYVANLYGNTVTIYGPNQSVPKATLSSNILSPVDVKVDGAGDVYVANSPGFGETSYILEFVAGQSSPSSAWYLPSSNLTISGITLLNPTSSPSIYASAYSSNPSGFATGGVFSCYPGNSNCVNVGPTLGQPGGISVEQSPGGPSPFEYLAVDQYVPGVDVFEPGNSPNPVRQLVTGGTPEFLTLNKARTRLFVADRFYGRVTLYSFATGKILNQFYPAGGNDTTQVYGVAISPSGAYL